MCLCRKTHTQRGEKMEEKLYKRWKEGFSTTLGAMILLILIATFLLAASLLTYYEVVRIVDMKENTKWLCLCACGIFEVGALLGAFLALIPYICDYRSLKEKKYTVIDGVVITFYDEDDGAEPPTTHRTPIVKDLQTDELIRIDTDQDVESEGHYLIFYLPRTKVSVWEKT